MGILDDDGDTESIAVDNSYNSSGGDFGDKVNDQIDEINAHIEKKVFDVNAYAKKRIADARHITVKELEDKMRKDLDTAIKNKKETKSKVPSMMETLTTTISDMIGSVSEGMGSIMKKISPTIKRMGKGIGEAVGDMTSIMGSILTGLFSPSEESPENTKSPVEQQVEDEKKLSSQIENTPATSQTEETTSDSGIKSLIDMSMKQFNTLVQISNISMASLKELKRISGDNSGNSPMIIQSPSSESNSSKPNNITLSNNRDAYYTSPYALA